MQEKMIIFEGYNGIAAHKADHVNDFLQDGWIVKSVNMAAEKDNTTAIIVLRKE